MLLDLLQHILSQTCENLKYKWFFASTKILNKQIYCACFTPAGFTQHWWQIGNLQSSKSSREFMPTVKVSTDHAAFWRGMPASRHGNTCKIYCNHTDWWTLHKKNHAKHEFSFCCFCSAYFAKLVLSLLILWYPFYPRAVFATLLINDQCYNTQRCKVWQQFAGYSVCVWFS